MCQLKIVLCCMVVTIFASQRKLGDSSNDGFLQSGKNWQHFSQICFGSERPVMVKFKYKFSYLKRYCCPNLLIYDEHDWPKVEHNTTASCDARQSILLWRQSERIINLTESHRHSGCSSTKKDGYIKCSDRRMFLARSTCWNFVISNCNNGKGIQMNYYISIQEDKPDKLRIGSTSISTTDRDVAKALNGGMHNFGNGFYLAVTSSFVIGAVYLSTF